MKTIGSIFSDIRRRGVLQTIAMYIVSAWIVLQASDVLFPGAGIPESAIRYVFVGAVFGFPLVLIFGWMYDISTKGVRRTPPAAMANSDGLALRNFDVAVIAGLALAMLVIVGSVTAKVLNEVGTVDLSEDEVAAGENSIAVLPFIDLSEDSANEYFVDGIAEELLNQLANVASLQVAARTSSFFFKGKNEPVQSIGRQLGVRTVLEGSVRRSGNRIRVTAQLINAADGYHLWSDNFDRELGDVFAIQEEIARAITDSLKVRLQAKESRQLASVPTENFEAYDFYLLGQFYREKRNPADLQKSIELFQQALDLDDRFAPAYSALALSYLYQAYYDDLPSEKVLALTDPLLDRCLELDPLLAEAHATRASVQLLLGNFAAAEEGYRKALGMKPNYAGAWSSLGFALVRQSRLKEAAQAYGRSEALDPLNASLRFNIGALHMLTGHYPEGLESMKTVLQIAPDRTRTENAIAYWSIYYGRLEEAARWSKRAAEREPDSPATYSLLAQLYGNLGMWEQSLEAASQAFAASPERTLYLDGVASNYFLVGDHARLASFVNDEYAKIDPLAPSGSSPMNSIRYFWHGVLAVLEGDYLQAVADLTDAAGGEEGISGAVYDEISTLKYLALAFRRQGRDEEANALLNQCLGLAREALEQGWATPTIFYRTAQIHALRGDADSAVQYLREAVDKGWRAAAELEVAPLWSNMQDDAEFQKIIMEVNDDIRQQRQQVTQLLGGPLP